MMQLRSAHVQAAVVRVMEQNAKMLHFAGLTVDVKLEPKFVKCQVGCVARIVEILAKID